MGKTKQLFVDITAVFALTVDIRRWYVVGVGRTDQYVCVREKERAIRACHCRHMKVSARRRVCVCLSKHNMRCRVCTATMFVLRLCFDSKYIVVVKRTPKFALPIPQKNR